MTADVTPFRIAIEQAVLDDLRERTARTRWPSHAPGMGWDYGADIDYLRTLADYWRTSYDWRARERSMNRLPHFRTRIEGLDIHFVHVRANRPDALPILLVHGWPSTFLEMTRLIVRLTTPDQRGRAYDVVIPSLPGYGFSDWPRQPGFGYRQVARLFATLMRERLGYDRYGVHGSDVGGFVIGWMGLQDRDRAITGIHTMQAGTPQPALTADVPPPTAEEQAYLDRSAAWEVEHGGYAHLQRTSPQSLAVGLNDSPMGLCTWIVEKLRRWSDCGGVLERRFAMDDVLDIVTLYWATQTGPSSMRSYYERVYFDTPLRPGERIAAPVAITVPVDRPGQPPHWAPPSFVERIYDVVQWTDLPTGGHFASWEEPDAVAGAMRRFFGRPDISGEEHA